MEDDVLNKTVNFEELMFILAKEGLDVVFYWDTVANKYAYKIYGFAKSSEGVIMQDDEGKLHLYTRYQRDDIITSLRDFLDVAYDWDSGYCTIEKHYYAVFGISPIWTRIYRKYGYNLTGLRHLEP